MKRNAEELQEALLAIVARDVDRLAAVSEVRDLTMPEQAEVERLFRMVTEALKDQRTVELAHLRAGLKGKLPTADEAREHILTLLRSDPDLAAAARRALSEDRWTA